MTLGIALVVIVNDKRAEADLIHKLYIHSKWTDHWMSRGFNRILEAKALVQKKKLDLWPGCFQSTVNEPFSILSDVHQHLDELFTKTEFWFIFNLYDLKNEN